MYIIHFRSRNLQELFEFRNLHLEKGCGSVIKTNINGKINQFHKNLMNFEPLFDRVLTSKNRNGTSETSKYHTLDIKYNFSIQHGMARNIPTSEIN